MSCSNAKTAAETQEVVDNAEASNDVQPIARREDDPGQGSDHEERKVVAKAPAAAVGAPAPDMIPVFQKLITKTWEAKYTRDRGGAEVPIGARVASVVKVKNEENWRRYQAHLASTRKARDGKCERFPVLTDGALASLGTDVNEMHLFHGTSPEAADIIARTDFDIKHAGSASGTMYGAGVYLAENASKSDEYATEGDGIFVGQCALLVCRAVAGSVYTTEAKGDMSAKALSGEYDSVCGDRRAAVGTFREMVFYNSDAVYCEYIVLYSRIFGKQAKPFRAYIISHCGQQIQDNNGTPTASRSGMDKMQLWTFKDAGDDQVYILSAQGKYLSVDGRPLVFRDFEAEATKWRITDADESKVRINSSTPGLKMESNNGRVNTHGGDGAFTHFVLKLSLEDNATLRSADVREQLGLALNDE